MNLADIPNYGEKDEDTKTQHVNKLLVDTTMSIDDTIGYTRFRENSLSEVESKFNPPEESDIARFCKESKYGYSFTPISPSPTLSTYSSMTLSSLGFGTTNTTSTAAAAIIGNRRKSCDRGLLCFLKIRNRLNQLNTGRRFSQPDFGIIDKQRSRYEMLSNHHPHNRSSNIESIPEFSILTPSSSSSFFKHHEENDEEDQMPIKRIESSPDSPILWSQDEYRFNSLNRVASEYNNDNNSTSVASIHPIKKNINSLNMSFTKSTPISITTTTNNNNNDDDSNNNTSHFTPSSASRYLRALHYPTRFLPQQQAILTTDVNGKVLLFNDISSLCFGIDQSFIGQSLFTKFDHHTQRTMKAMLQQRKHMQKASSTSSSLLPTNNNNNINDSSVLVCGGIIPIIKEKGKKATAASLWLKERWNNNQGKFIYLWVFEEIYESQLTVIIDSKGRILDTSSTTIYELYGYQRSDVIGQSIKTLLPSINTATMETNNNNNNELKVNTNKFYTSKTKSGKFFPSMVHLQNNKLLITSLPTISGLITIHRNGMIQSMNPVPAKYLFGYKTKDAVETIHINKLLPQFMTLVQLLDEHHLLHYNRMVSSEECIELLQQQQQQQQGIVAIHHDGNQFNVELQIRLIESDEEDLYSVWITYNRISTTKTIETTSIINTTNHYRNDIENNNYNNTNNNITKEETSIHLTKNLDENENNQFHASPSTTMTATVTTTSMTTTTKTTTKTTTASIKINDDNQFKKKNEQPLLSGSPQISRISCFGSVPKEKALFPMHREEDEEQDKNTSSSLSPPPPQQQQQQQGSLAPIIFPELDDYVIMGSLGEGAYGSAKLVHLRSDPKQEFVIKAIVKSRIVIDSWVRDRKYGSIPIEIHILLKLQQHQHMNCPRLVKFIEDDDNYYTITQLHGDGMDLFDYIELNENIPEQQVRKIFYQAVSAVQHLHHLKIVHRDIKDENILLDEHGVVQLIDFGSAAYFREGKLFDTFSGTLDYCAPEILNGNAYAGPPQDVWCLGILLYTLIYRETPFYSVDDIMERKLQLPYLPFQGKSQGVVDLIYKLLDKDYQRRPTIDEIMEDKWLLQKG